MTKVGAETRPGGEGRGRPIESRPIGHGPKRMSEWAEREGGRTEVGQKGKKKGDCEKRRNKTQSFEFREKFKGGRNVASKFRILDCKMQHLNCLNKRRDKRKGGKYIQNWPYGGEDFNRCFLPFFFACRCCLVLNMHFMAVYFPRPFSHKNTFLAFFGAGENWVCVLLACAFTCSLYFFPSATFLNH